MYSPELVLSYLILNWEHVFTFLSENMAKMLFAPKSHYSKANKAIDIGFAENLD